MTRVGPWPHAVAAKARSLLVLVVTLLAHGCPPQAIVAAFGLGERTVADRYAKAGRHAHDVHHHFLGTRPLDLGHVQADELYAKCVGGRCWMALALAVPCRLWLGGVVGRVRDLGLIQRLVDLVRLAWLPGRALLLCVDGLGSYPTAFWRAFREKVFTGRRGRPSYRKAATCCPLPSRPLPLAEPSALPSPPGRIWTTARWRTPRIPARWRRRS